MPYPESQGSCGGKVGEESIALMKASSIGFSVPTASGLADRTQAHRAYASRKSASTVKTMARRERSQVSISLCWLPLSAHRDKPQTRRPAKISPLGWLGNTPKEASTQKM